MQNLVFPEGFLPTFRTRINEQLYELASELHESQRFAESLETLHNALRETTELQAEGDAPSVRDGVILAAWNLHQLRQYDKCREWLRAAVAEGRLPADDPDAVLVELWIKWSEGRYEEILAQADPYIERFSGQLNPLLAEFLLIRGNTQLKLGQLSAAYDDCGAAYAFFKVLKQLKQQAEVCNILGIVTFQQAKYNDALRWLHESLTINQELGQVRRIGDNHLNIGLAYYKKGDYQEALRYLESACQVDQDVSSPHLLCRAKIALGNVHRLLRDFDTARSNLMAAYTLATQYHLVREECLALEFLGDVFRDEGKQREARRYYARGLAIAQRIAPEGDLVMELLRRDGECLAVLGRPAEAISLLERARTLATHQGDRFEEGVILRCLADAAMRLKDWKRAQECIDTSLAFLESIHARHEQAMTHLYAARLYEQRLEESKSDKLAPELLTGALQHAMSAQRLFRRHEVDHWISESDRIVSSLAWLHLQDVGDQDRGRGIISEAEIHAQPEVVAVSAAMRAVLQQAETFARCEEPVLVTGQTGTGKEVVARRIHELGPRRQRPFVAVNCAAIPATLFEREFFGHRKGAYTGAENDRPGFVAQADGGTLFLDEIGELPLELQPKLLRLLQEGTYTRLGDPDELRADVRLVAATNADLDELVAERRFRQDLNFRLKVLEINLPPLCERTDDILPLLQHYLSRLAGHHVTVWNYFNNESVQNLRRYSWPGNVREVIMVARRAHIGLQTEGRTLIQLGAGSNGLTLTGPARQGDASDVTRNQILRTLAETGGNKAETARRFGVSRQTLYRWIRRHGIAGS